MKKITLFLLLISSFLVSTVFADKNTRDVFYHLKVNSSSDIHYVMRNLAFISNRAEVEKALLERGHDLKCPTHKTEEIPGTSYIFHSLRQQLPLLFAESFWATGVIEHLVCDWLMQP